MLKARRPLKILFATTHPHMPQIAGGLQASTADSMRMLAARGHDTRLLCGLTGDGLLGLRHRLRLKLGRSRIATDASGGVATYRAWHSAAPDVAAELCQRFAPDIVLAQGGGAVHLAATFGRLAVPAVIQFRNVEFDGLADAVAALDPATIYLSNSGFTQARARAELGVESRVIYPIVDAAKYRTLPQGTHCVFVNPHPSKGIETALAMAEACSDIPFLIVEAWTLDSQEASAHRRRGAALANVTWLRRMADMRRVYAKARLMLVPSKWEEAFGRVVAEAQVSGIPAIASDIGGLPEAVGPGGLLVDPEAPTAHWVAALRRLWDDRGEQDRLSAAALRHAQRPEMNAKHQTDLLEQAIRDRLAAAEAGDAQPVPVRQCQSEGT